MIEHDSPRRVVILRMLTGGMLVLLSLPLLSPLIVGTLVTRAINDMCVLTRRLRSERGRHE